MTTPLLVTAIDHNQLSVLQGAIADLWEFGATTIDPVTSSALNAWVAQKELTVAVAIKDCQTPSDIQAHLDNAVRNQQTCGGALMVATFRLACLHRDAIEAVLASNHCPASLYAIPPPNTPSSEVVHGFYDFDKRKWGPAAPSLTRPRVHAAHDLVMYATTSFVRKGYRGGGIYPELVLRKFASQIPAMTSVLSAGHCVFIHFVVNSEASGKKVALGNMHMMAAVIDKVARAMGAAPSKGFRLVEWSMWDDVHNFAKRSFLLCLDPKVELAPAASRL